MNAWYKFILNVLFSKKSENKDWEMTDEEEEIYLQITLNWIH